MLQVGSSFSNVIKNYKKKYHFWFVVAVQEERGPRKRRTSSYSSEGSAPANESNRCTERINSLSRLSTPDDLHYQILAQILIACIRQAKINENFRCFNVRQQNRILKNVWSECFVLRASHWSIDIGSIVERYLIFDFMAFG